jgi:stage IV sporulation protein FB
MLFSAPQPTKYDLHFRLLGIPVIVHPLFFAFAAIVSFDLVELSVIFWLCAIACIFVTFLIHEMGHALAMKYFKAYPDIRLQFMSAFAAPDVHIVQRWKRVVCIAAGPGLGLLFAFAVYLSNEVQPWVGADASLIVYLYLFVGGLTLNLLNLIPIIPLDGGQLMMEGLIHIKPRQGLRMALQISIFVAMSYVLYCLLCMAKVIAPVSIGTFYIPFDFYLIFILSLLAFQNYQMLQKLRQPWN